MPVSSNKRRRGKNAGRSLAAIKKSKKAANARNQKREEKQNS